MWVKPDRLSISWLDIIEYSSPIYRFGLGIGPVIRRGLFSQLFGILAFPLALGKQIQFFRVDNQRGGTSYWILFLETTILYSITVLSHLYFGMFVGMVGVLLCFLRCIQKNNDSIVRYQLDSIQRFASLQLGMFALCSCWLMPMALNWPFNVSSTNQFIPKQSTPYSSPPFKSISIIQRDWLRGGNPIKMGTLGKLSLGQFSKGMYLILIDRSPYWVCWFSSLLSIPSSYIVSRLCWIQLPFFHYLFTDIHLWIETSRYNKSPLVLSRWVSTQWSFTTGENQLGEALFSIAFTSVCISCFHISCTITKLFSDLLSQITEK